MGDGDGDDVGLILVSGVGVTGAPGLDVGWEEEDGDADGLEVGSGPGDGDVDGLEVGCGLGDGNVDGLEVS